MKTVEITITPAQQGKGNKKNYKFAKIVYGGNNVVPTSFPSSGEFITAEYDKDTKTFKDYQYPSKHAMSAAKFLWSEAKSIATVDLGFILTKGEDYKKAVGDFIGHFKTEVPKMYNLLADFNTSVTDYLTTKDPTKKPNILKNNLKIVKDLRSSIFGSLDDTSLGQPEKADVKAATKGAIAENKKNEINSLKRLDKLIEQVILYKNTEEK